METVDLTKVAGFKALDSDGNELGIVSMEQLTDSIAMRIADGLSERTVLPANNVPMAVAATSTGSDKMETAFSETTDPAYVRVIDKNGNSAKQGISSLASVVGGLIGAATSTKDGLATKRMFKAAGLCFNIAVNSCLKIERNVLNNGQVSINITAFDGPTWSTNATPRKVLLNIPYDSGSINNIYAKNLLDAANMKIYKDSSFNLYLKAMDTYSTTFVVEIIQNIDVFSNIYPILLTDVPNLDSYEKITIH